MPPARSARGFATLRTVEDDPDAEVVAEVLEAVGHAGRDEQDVVWAERVDVQSWDNVVPGRELDPQPQHTRGLGQVRVIGQD